MSKRKLKSGYTEGERVYPLPHIRGESSSSRAGINPAPTVRAMFSIANQPWYAILFIGLFVSALLFCCPAPLSAYRLPDTDQRKCYRDVDPYDEISCAGTGQDGAYIQNPLSYTDNANGSGTVTDNNTGLVWQKEDDGNTYNWYQATGTYDTRYNPKSKDVCGSLTLGGHSDWRLPSKKELVSIVDYAIPYPGPTISTAHFSNTKASNYWSSTSYNYWSATWYADRPHLAWPVHFGIRSVENSYRARSGRGYVRCVRSGE